MRLFLTLIIFTLMFSCQRKTSSSFTSTKSQQISSFEVEDSPIKITQQYLTTTVKDLSPSSFQENNKLLTAPAIAEYNRPARPKKTKLKPLNDLSKNEEKPQKPWWKKLFDIILGILIIVVIILGTLINVFVLG